MNINTVKDLKDAFINGPYAWPGGYPMYFITSDGAALSFSAAVENMELVEDSIETGSDDGWRIVAFDINWEDGELYCDHTNEKIEAAYC